MKLTVKDLFALKGQRKLTQIYIRSAKEAAACEAGGIDMIVTTEQENITRAVRKAAPNIFFTFGLNYGRHVTIPDALRAAYDAMSAGADAIYCPQSLDYVTALSAEGIPTIGHVGLVPYKSTWFGGFKAVGKTLDEALAIYKRAIAFQEAGAIGVEVELVPEQVAAAISARLKILTFGMGAGAGCDAEYLFATDVLGDNEGHVPRHAKVYRNHKADYERLHQDSIAAFAEFKADVISGAYPEPRHLIRDKPDVVAEFLQAIERF